MADIADIANDYAEQELADRLFGRVQYVGQSATHCEDCGEGIPEARRVAVMGCVRCTECADLEERRHG